MGLHTRASAQEKGIAGLAFHRHCCAQSGCGARLNSQNSSGYCAFHFNTLRAKRPVADEVIGIRRKPARVAVFPHEVIRSVASELGLAVKDIVGPSQKNELVAARAACAVVLRRAGMRYKKIAECLGRENHTTTTHGVRHFPEYAARDPRLEPLVARLTASLNRNQERA